MFRYEIKVLNIISYLKINFIFDILCIESDFNCIFFHYLHFFFQEYHHSVKVFRFGSGWTEAKTSVTFALR